ncbi:hypothetical protein [Butyrivibrio sp. AE3004]|uniref:hypothetical protein n=1 Tax=Butyrivibrio sp. AE3004 TaxID=1506994 RepID=UPI0004940D37|nr:hypothetical protein [Butyrivibrio sp. AE3004]
MNKKIIATTIYILGICCVLFFGASAVFGGNTVSNPEAMIPFTEFERNIIMLGMGFIPMIASCLFMLYAYGIKERSKRILVLIPGIVTGIPFIVGACFVVYLIFLGMLDVIGMGA